eukprot:m.16371 g.16371  ORF g.16371 m.16371 type:complete len:589 (+) comp5683_c0_seq1:72-1838(+)
MNIFAVWIFVVSVVTNTFATSVEQDEAHNLVLIGDEEVHVRSFGSEAQSLTQTMRDVNMLTEDIYGRRYVRDTGDYDARPLTLTNEDILTQMKTMVAQMHDLQMSMDSCEKQGAQVSFISGCGVNEDCKFPLSEHIEIFGRNFIQTSSSPAYTAEFTIAASLGSSKVSKISSCTSSVGILTCEIPPMEAIDREFEVLVTIREGLSEVIGGTNLKITLTSSFGISFIPDQLFIDHVDINKKREFPLTIIGLGGVSTVPVASSDNSIVQVSIVQSSGNTFVLTLTVSGYGVATVNVTNQRSFTVTHRKEFQSCEEAKDVIPGFKAGTYTIALGGETYNVYCEVYGGVAFTMCGKYRLGDVMGLESPFARANINPGDLLTPWEFGSNNSQQASLDCRKLVENGATHMLSACYEKDDTSGYTMARITNLPKEMIKDPTYMFDPSKDTATLRQDLELSKIHTWWYQSAGSRFVQFDGKDCGDEKCWGLGAQAGYNTPWGFTNIGRKGALYANGVESDGIGTESDTVFWAWKGPTRKIDTVDDWSFPDYTCAASKGGRSIGTPCHVDPRISLRSGHGHCDISVMYLGSPELPYY